MAQKDKKKNKLAQIAKNVFGKESDAEVGIQEIHAFFKSINMPTNVNEASIDFAKNDVVAALKQKNMLPLGELKDLDESEVLIIIS